MSEGYTLVLLLVLCLLYGKVCGVRNEMKRIADFCERSERRMQGTGGRHG